MVAAGSDTLHRIDLNIPSIDATTMCGSITTHRTAINVSGKNQTLDVQITQPRASRSPSANDNHALKIAKGGSVTFPITIDAPSVANGQYQGRINLVPRNGANRVTIPVAFVKKQGAVTLTQQLLASVLRGAHRRVALHRLRGELLAAVGKRGAERRRPEGQEAPVQERRRSRAPSWARVKAFSGAAPSRRRFRRR